MRFCLLSLLISMVFAVTIDGLNLSLDVPSSSYVGESIELVCSYNLGDDLLYSVKWYKDDVEFFRYLPKTWPPGQFLPIPGVKLDLQKSARHSIYLKEIDIYTAGIYKCEVSTEGPYFVTAEDKKTLEVTVLPITGPEIFGGQIQYKVGDRVNLTCVSAKSKPSATLRWFINDQEAVSNEYETTSYSTTLHSDGLETSSLGLQFTVKEKDFRNDNLRLKCTATIKQIHVMSNEALALKQSDNSEPVVEKQCKSVGLEPLEQVTQSIAVSIFNQFAITNSLLGYCVAISTCCCLK